MKHIGIFLIGTAAGLLIAFLGVVNLPIHNFFSGLQNPKNKPNFFIPAGEAIRIEVVRTQDELHYLLNRRYISKENLKKSVLSHGSELLVNQFVILELPEDITVLETYEISRNLDFIPRSNMTTVYRIKDSALRGIACPKEPQNNTVETTAVNGGVSR